ncbi:MAG: asparagine synthase-related protein [Ilumatobacteraceae bacterium]
MSVFAVSVAVGRASAPSVAGTARVLDGHGSVSTRLGDDRLDVLVRHTGAADDACAVRYDEADRPVLVVVADATLYRRSELAASLGVPAGTPIAELILVGYERWGRDLPDRLLGRFAIVVVDRRSGGEGVFLAVDHAGERPLSFHLDSDRLVVSSLALALTEVEGVGHELDTDRLAELVALAFGGTRSIVRGVEHVAAGSSVWVANGVPSRGRWWSLDDVDARDLGSFEAHAEQLRNVFHEVTADAIDGFGRLGVSLSGGLDSTSVAATAALLRPDEVIRTYTSVPPPGANVIARRGWEADERHVVESLARRHPNLAPRWVTATGQGLVDRYEQLWELGLPPQRNTMNLMWIHAIDVDAAADGVDLLLTGARGNRHFSADGPRWLVDLLVHARLRDLWAESTAWAEATGVGATRVLRDHLVVPMLPERVRWWRRRRQGRIDPVERWFGATAIAGSRRESVDLRELLPQTGTLDSTWWLRSTTHLFDGAQQAAETQVVGRAVHGFDTVDPTSDRRIVEVALRQPERWRRRRGFDRAIVRAAMADRLPPEVARRRERGEQLPDWFDRLHDVREELVAEVDAAHDHPGTRDVIDTARLQDVVRRMPARGAALSGQDMRDYRLAVPRALLLSRYVRWFERRGASVGR